MEYSGSSANMQNIKDNTNIYCCIIRTVAMRGNVLHNKMFFMLGCSDGGCERGYHYSLQLENEHTFTQQRLLITLELD